jgi:UDP-GlcNAc:undecaprenyl-phosphate GlcNAc-1-phosphate transferase
MWTYLAIISISALLLSVLYINLASIFGIYDNPGGRSSHSSRTITGMGIIFPLLIVIYSIFYPQEIAPYFIIGFLMMVTISFVDDLFYIKHSVRLVFQVFALILMVLSLAMNYEIALPVMITLVIFGIGVINAFNFMDGVNGMLGLTSLVVLGSFYYLNENLVGEDGLPLQFVHPELILTVMAGLVAFLIFNFRTKAKAFAGDVGSIGLSMTIIYMMYKLLLVSGNYTYLLLFAVFGIDAGLTVIYKLILKENIFVPHRDFLFKKLVHIAKFKHLRVSIYYALIQLMINVFILFQPMEMILSTQLSILFIIIVGLISIYILSRSRLTKNRIRINFIERD